jgi:hypothetical protein
LFETARPRDGILTVPLSSWAATSLATSGEQESLAANLMMASMLVEDLQWCAKSTAHKLTFAESCSILEPS